MKTCPRCIAAYPDTASFCETDGTALATDLPQGHATTLMSDEEPAHKDIECAVCGGRALPGEVRCNFCGARLQADGFESSERTSSSKDGPSESGASARSLSEASEFNDPPIVPPASSSTKKRKRLFTLLGLSSAAVAALAAGAWFALYLGNNHLPSKSQTTPSAKATPTLTIELARQTPLSVRGDTAGKPPRDTDSLLKAFEDNKAGLANVYGSALGSDPSMTDAMVARVHILPDGRVDNGAVVVSTSGNPSFDAEVVEAITSWKFLPINGSGVTADYRMIFAPSASAVSGLESDLTTKLASLSPSDAPEYAFSPSGTTSTEAGGAGLSSMPSRSATGAGTSAEPSNEVAGGVGPAPVAESTTVIGLPPSGYVATAEATPGERRSTPARVRHRHAAPREMAALPPPKPPLIERVNSELQANRKLRRVRAYNNGSVVTIFGKVFDENDRLMAERIVRNTDGVSAVVNNLTPDTQQWEQNQTLITQALQNAGFNNVRVKVIGRDAYLSGQVKTQLDRERAVTVAQAAAPVKVRENLITVALGNILGF